MRTDISDYDDNEDDSDAPLASDMDDGCDADDDDMVCPACGKGVAIDTPKCPHCGDWIRPIAPGGRLTARWVKIVVIILLGTGVVQLLSAIFQ